MASSKDLNEFMNKQNKQFVGEKVNTETNNVDDNFLSEREKAQNYDTKYSSSGNDQAYLAARKTLSTIFRIPVIIAVMASIILILLKVTPIVLGYIRQIFIIFMMGGN